MKSKIILSLRSLITLMRFVISILDYKVRRLPTSAVLLHHTFYTFGGLPGTLASKLLGKRKVNLDKSVYPALRESSPRTVQSSLEREGFFLEQNFLSKQESADVVKFALENVGSYRGTDLNQGSQENILFNRSNPLAVRFDYTPTQALRSEVIQKVVADERILSIAQTYLGCQPILDFVAMWWHTKSNQPDKKAAQFFHFDMDRLRWLKFFFYVTDVEEINGPHVFIPTSHRDYGIPFSIRKRGYARLTDEEVEAKFPKSIWKTFVSPAGTMIVEDTRGLHKGSHVISGDRLLFQLQFTSCLYGEAEEDDNMSIEVSDLTSNLREATYKFPYIYQKIKIKEPTR